LFVILGLFCLDKQPTSDKLYGKGLDWGGALLSTAGLGLLTYSLAYVLRTVINSSLTDTGIQSFLFSASRMGYAIYHRLNLRLCSSVGHLLVLRDVAGEEVAIRADASKYLEAPQRSDASDDRDGVLCLVS
jgi:hypothetical protein